VPNDQQEPRIIPGTPPTPDDPSASNETIIEYPDGSFEIRTSHPTPEILREYQEAIEIYPGDAGLHCSYGHALAAAGERDAAIREVRQAIEIDPADVSTRISLAGFLRETGNLDEAIVEYQAAMKLYEECHPGVPDQTEAILHWGLAEALRMKGNSLQADEQLRFAIAVQAEAVKDEAGSPALLQQLEELLAKESDR
jgi:tetratricopeptide (TPR) repeat protein